jgi:MOSC domain-containing protein YiiM
VQVTLINTRLIALVAQSQERWALAGDNLYVDLDLSQENIKPGQQLSIGSVILEVTDIPHKGCEKFVERYGADANQFVNSEEGQRMSLRGIFARILQAGTVEVGDEVKKV